MGLFSDDKDDVLDMDDDITKEEKGFEEDSDLGDDVKEADKDLKKGFPGSKKEDLSDTGDRRGRKGTLFPRVNADNQADEFDDDIDEKFEDEITGLGSKGLNGKDDKGLY